MMVLYKITCTNAVDSIKDHYALYVIVKTQSEECVQYLFHTLGLNTSKVIWNEMKCTFCTSLTVCTLEEL